MANNSSDLQWAAFQGELDKVRSLIEAGAAPNSKGDCGAGTLFTFHPRVIEFLISQGATPDTQNNDLPLSGYQMIVA